MPMDDQPLPLDIKIDPLPEEDRYTRLRQVGWKADVLQSARIIVAGAGALGNEVIKNLALLGIGEILVLDFDAIEVTNLSRSVLFRPGDIGKLKAEVAAIRAKDIYPALNINWFNGDLCWEVGAGVFRHFDTVISCVDNRAARVTINRYCWLIGRPWFEGGLDGLDGHIRLYGASQAPCYECGLSEADYISLSERYSCLGNVTSAEGESVPTSPTSSSIVAAMLVQEVVRWLHGLPVAFGTEVVYTSVPPQLVNIILPGKADCLGHEIAEPLIELDGVKAKTTTLRELLAIVQEQFDAEESAISLEYEIVTRLSCATCGQITPWLGPLFRLTTKEQRCPDCGTMRLVESTHRISRDTAFLDMTLHEVGIPAGHIVVGHYGGRYKYFELAGDFDTAIFPAVT